MELEPLCQLVKQQSDLSFSLFEIGARPISAEKEPFYQLLDHFPNSTITAFEPDEALCEQLNNRCRKGIHYHPHALAGENRRQSFYQTNNPMCSSLYRPNEALLKRYNNMQVSMLKEVNTIDTMTLDHFINTQNTGSVDFIKIDIQGAELDVFKSALEALKSTLFIVSEVEFIPLYINQPLFGDVCEFLDQQGFMFHKFLGFGGRALAPVKLLNNINTATQLMWSDAVFIKHIDSIASISEEQLLKMAVLAFIYGSPDITYHCFRQYDLKNGTLLHKAILN